MAFDDQTVESDEDGTIIASGVHSEGESFDLSLSHEVSKFSEEGSVEAFAEGTCEHFHDSFTCFDGDIPCESVCDDDVCFA